MSVLKIRLTHPFRYSFAESQFNTAMLNLFYLFLEIRALDRKISKP